MNYTSINCAGETVNGTLEWNGRQLVAVNQGNRRYEYSYNADGLRSAVKKYVNNVLESIQYYIWQNGKLMGYYNEDKIGNDDTSVKMLYDKNGELIGLRLVDEQLNYDKVLFFRKNLQGDIQSVYDSFGNQVLTYTYDAWGNVTVTVHDDSTQSTISASMALNYVPITYRGYMYDANTGLYYLQSRYYNPTYGRFLNADTTEILEATQGTPLGANLFAYCNNNPVNYVDYRGMLCVGFGLFFSAALVLATSVAFMIIGDSEGNAGLFLILSIGVGSPSLSGGISLMIDSSETIFDLEGWAFSLGGSAGEGAMIGGDILLNDTGITGTQLAIGATAKLPFPFELHGLATRTFLLYSWRISSSVIANTIRGVYELLEFYGFKV